jgi:dTDP-4-dehydrorhamnose reductase
MRVLLTGASGFLGSALHGELIARGHEVSGSRPPGAPRRIDLASPGAGARLVEETAPDALLHAAAMADIGPCAADPALAQRVNADAPAELAAACALRRLRMLHVSTDQVFDGRHGAWREEDEPAPRHDYGASKLAGERGVLAACPDAMVVRLALLTGAAPEGRRSSSSSLLQTLARGGRPQLFRDEWRTPLAVLDAARALVDLLERETCWQGASGAPLPGCSGRLLHLGGPERLSRLELGRRIAEVAGFAPDLCLASTRAEAGQVERPADLSLDSRRCVALLGWTPRVLTS